MSGSVISFDAAGTLIHLRQPVGQTYAEFAHRHGVSVEESALKQAFRTVWGQVATPLRPEGQSSTDDDRSWWHGLVGEVFAHALQSPLPEALLDPLFDDLYTHYARPDAWSVFDDVRPALTVLAQDHRLCVLSNFDRRLRGILIGHGLDHFFEHIILSSEVGAAKPHRRMFETAQSLMKAETCMSWHVGDDEHCDIWGAQSCGWHAFGVSRPERSLLHLVEKVHSEGIRTCATSGKG